MASTYSQQNHKTRTVTAIRYQALMEAGQKFATDQDVDVVRDVKEKLCYVSMNFDQDMKDAMECTTFEKNYELPDGTLLTVNSERFRCPEVLFQPGFISNEGSGIHDRVFNAIQHCAPELRQGLYANVLLSGGGTLIPDFDTRLQREVQGLAPSDCKVTVVAPEERHHSCWIGGSVLASLSTFQQMWVTKVLVGTPCG